MTTEAVRRACWRPLLSGDNDDQIEDLRLQIAGIKATLNELSEDIEDILGMLRDKKRRIDKGTGE